jgi:hypothetical protein
MAQIQSLEQMELIVNQNKMLSWDGWTVVSSLPSIKGRTSPDGAYVKGKWYIQKRYEITKNGWDIPNKLLENREQKRMER